MTRHLHRVADVFTSCVVALVIIAGVGEWRDRRLQREYAELCAKEGTQS